MVAHPSDPTTREAEAGGSGDQSRRVQGHFGLWMEEDYKGRGEGVAQSPEEASLGQAKIPGEIGPLWGVGVLALAIAVGKGCRAGMVPTVRKVLFPPVKSTVFSILAS